MHHTYIYIYIFKKIFGKDSKRLGIRDSTSHWNIEVIQFSSHSSSMCIINRTHELVKKLN